MHPGKVRLRFGPRNRLHSRVWRLSQVSLRAETNRDLLRWLHHLWLPTCIMSFYAFLEIWNVWGALHDEQTWYTHAQMKAKKGKRVRMDAENGE